MSALAYKLRGKLNGVFKHWLGKSTAPESGDSVTQPTPAKLSGTAPTAQTPQTLRCSNSSPGSDYALELPLQTILNQLQPELKPLVVANASNLTVAVPIQTILPQLAHGCVRIALGELRALAPGIFSGQTDRDHVLVQLPLAEILPKINPALLRRRPGQKQVKIPDDVVGPFTEGGKGVFISSSKPTPQQPVAPRPAQPTAATTEAAPSSFGQHKPRTPTVSAVPPVSSPLLPVMQATATSPQRSVEQQPKPPGPPPHKAQQPAIPLRMTAPIAESAPIKPTHQNQPPITPVERASAARPVSLADVLVVPIAQLWESWPEIVKHEIATCNLARAVAALPVEFVQAGLKQARVTCTWEQLRQWLHPRQPAGVVSACDDVILELPLRVLAPLFIARQPKPLTQKKTEFDAGIPDLFVGAGTAPAPDFGARRHQPAPESPAAVTASQLGVLEPKPVTGVPETDYYVWRDDRDVPAEPAPLFKKGSSSPGTDFLRRFAPPKEIVGRAVALDGVAGALIALPDGLLVAAQVPPDFNADTLAAFLPQMFARVSQCTRELRMGELNNLNFTVGNVPWRIFKVGAIFFAAFGRAGVPLPTAQLAELAAELDRKPRH